MRGRLFTVCVGLWCGGCVEDAYQNYLAALDAGPPAPSDGGPTDAGLSGAGMTDAGMTDAGPSDGGDGGIINTTCKGASACTSDWSQFLQCGSAGQRLCIVSDSGVPIFPEPGPSPVDVHGPAMGFAETAVAFTNSNSVFAAIAGDGGVMVTAAMSLGTTPTSIAVSDGHDYDATNTDCADAIFTFDAGGGYLLGCTPFGGPPAGLFADAGVPLFAAEMSWVPSGGNFFHALGVASGGSTSSFYFEATPLSGPPVGQSTLPIAQLQGIPNSPEPFVNPGNCPDGGQWWLYAPSPGNGGGLVAVPHCLASPTSLALTTPVPVDGDVKMTATAAGGALVVGFDAGAIFAFQVDATFDAGSAAWIDPGLGPLISVTEVRWGQDTTIFRIVFLDALTQTPRYVDLDLGGAPPVWLGVMTPVDHPGGVVFAAPMFPHMLLTQDVLGDLAVSWLP